MGMTRVFYFVKKNQLTQENIREKLKGTTVLGAQSFSVFYQTNKDWLPVFDAYYCEGQYNADKEFMVSLEELFGAPVIALATFDSDVAFVSIYERGELHCYVHADEFMLEEFGFEEYESMIPTELKNYVDGEELQKIWDGEYIFAEDLLQDIANLLNTFLVFDENEAEEDVEVITGNQTRR